MPLSNIDDLRKIGYENLNNFSLTIPVSEFDDTSDIFHCSKITRCLPGKRISCSGRWKGRAVFAKFFIASKRAKIHWQKEKKGFDLLSKKQILAPNILHYGKHKHDEIYFILFEFLENTLDLQDIWDNANESRRLQLLKQLIATLAEHHDKGIVQQDLHLNNFLLSNNSLYTLDGSDITAFDSDNKQIASNNLALLFAQFYPSNDPQIKLVLDYYTSLRHWEHNQQRVNHINTSALTIREKRKKELLRKTGRSCSLFCFQHTWKQLTICARKYQSKNMQDFLQSPDSYIDQGELLKRGNTCTVAIVTVDNIKIVVKRYNIKNWRHFLTRALRPSRAIRSWTNAHLLRFYGISTPEPIAVIEKRWGPIRKTAYFVSELSPGETGDLFFRSAKRPLAEKEAVAQSIVKLLHNLHRLKISHGDLKIANIMVFGLHTTIIDLDSMKQHLSQYSFKKAKTRDLKRFFKNWLHAPSTGEIFRRQFENLK